jgi:glycosyltransferase involved in cell wall biosynthesis
MPEQDIKANDKKNPILIRVRRLHLHDATSQDILTQARYFRQLGRQVSIYAAHVPLELQSDVVSLAFADDLLRNKETIVIHHFNGFDADLPYFLRKNRGKSILRYHNITPSKWFWKYSIKSALYSILGTIQVKLCVALGRFDLVLTPSIFNLKGLFSCLPKRILPAGHLFPIVIDLAEFTAKSKRTLIPSNQRTAIFVGRFAPNKCLDYFLDFLSEWNISQLKTRAKFTLKVIIAGKIGAEFSAYYKDLLARANSLGLAQQLLFQINPSRDDILNLYSSSDVFLSFSEHEGFLVPILEAQAAGLPVLAAQQPAVAETLGTSGVIVARDKKVFKTTAEECLKILSDQSYNQTITALGKQNLQRFDPITICKNALEAIDGCP